MSDKASCASREVLAAAAAAAAPNFWVVVSDTYEQTEEGTWSRVVRHEFFGDTPEQAIAVFRVHRKFDSFFGDCTTAEAADALMRSTQHHKSDSPGLYSRSEAIAVDEGSFQGSVTCKTRTHLEQRIPTSGAERGDRR